MLSVVERVRGNMELSRALQDRSLASYRALGEHFGVSLILADMAWTAACTGEYERARRLAEEALASFSPDDPATQHSLALALFGLEEREQAFDIALDALRTSWERRDILSASAALDLIAAISADAGDDARAARLTGGANALLERVGAAASELDAARGVYGDTIERARERAGVVWDRELAVGGDLELGQAVDDALALGTAYPLASDEPSAASDW